MNPQEQVLRQTLETGAFTTNFLVEAGAGAGKSHTICQRILHQLAGGHVPPESVVAITFTEKATLELKEKLDGQALAYDRANGTQLAQKVQQVHISTIHSFCQKLLSLFPLESGCPLSMQVADASLQLSRQRAFFRRQTLQDPAGRFAAFEAFGTSRRTLEGLFLDVVNDRESQPVYADPADPASGFAARMKELDDLLDDAHQTLHSKLATMPDGPDLMPTALWDAVSAAAPTAEQKLTLKLALLQAEKGDSFRMNPLFFTAQPAVAHDLALFQACLTFQGYEAAGDGDGQAEWAREILSLVPQPPLRADGLPDAAALLSRLSSLYMAAAQCLSALTVSHALPAIAELNRTLGYDLALAAVVPAARDFHARHGEDDACFFDDLLIRARDLVRDVPAARAVLRRRYQVFYVDEFQDTDPVQAQLFFLLTHGADDGERDWTRCRPAPGSLFLVGDPKQAIYRFRGADLDIYKQVKGLFLQSPNPIGRVVELKTNFRSNAQICSFVDQVFGPRKRKGQPILTPSEQENNRTNPKVGKTLDNGLYQAGYTAMEAEQGDAGRPMVFRYPNFGDKNDRLAEDSLKLARFIRHAVSGNHTLRDRKGNPVPIRFGDFLILTRTKRACQRYLDALSALGIPVSFAGERQLSQVPPVARLAAHLRYLLDPDNEVLLTRLLMECYGFDKLDQLPALRKEAQCPLTRLVSWPEKRQALTGGSFDPLLGVLDHLARLLSLRHTLPPAAFLEHLAAEGEGLLLPGDPTDPLVRQSWYVCLEQFLQLARQCPWTDFARAARYALEISQTAVERELSLTPGEDRVRVMNLHKAKGLEGKIVILALDGPGRISISRTSQVDGSGVRKGYYTVRRRTADGYTLSLYAPQDWGQLSQPESCHNKAEQVRLRYVAATRAEQLLLIASGDPTGAKPDGKINAWAELAKEASNLPPAGDSFWGDLFQPLAQDALSAPPPPPILQAQPAFQDRSGQLSALITEASRTTLAHISPSALDKSHPVHLSPDPEEVTPPPPASDDSPAEPAAAGPMGADWGTMVHRAMEFYVNARPAGPTEALPLIRRAVTEVLPSPRFTGQQIALLFGGHPPADYDTGVEQLAGAIVKATAFWFDPASPLRKLAEGQCFAEYPFHLRLTDPSEPLYHYIRSRLKDVTDDPDVLSVSGILDLAVLAEGQWHIVDYKTDHIRTGESPEEYRARLAGEYAAQLQAYIQILARLTGLPVADAQLCAIPLGGDFIPIPLE